MLRRVPPSLYYQQEAPNPRLSLRYLGTAGFVLEGAGTTLVIDPFVTRPGLLTTAFRRLEPNRALIRRILPRADHVLVGHAHHDHVLDAPDLCLQTGATFIGSPSACNVARAAGLPEDQIRTTRGREDIDVGAGVARGIPSRHGKVYFGRIPLPGEILEPPPWPPRFTELRHGLVLNWHVELAGVRVVHVDSADFIEEEMEGLQCDVLCLCAIGRKYRPDYTKTAISMLKPRLVIPCHWDSFFSHYDREPRCLPAVNLPGFMDEIRSAGAEAVLLPFEGVLGV
jgi:L-ascorbate metabolism protein UlaG (beta-lactamase superfamily)